ncbi:MAG TPA: YggS family pyridoxal phosphate-dependent enzyme [Firmicutes bacterium]|nr:YggS family pyridoxal phosphate-dependent enzyme [Bacillota bacterium]
MTNGRLSKDFPLAPRSFIVNSVPFNIKTYSFRWGATTLNMEKNLESVRERISKALAVAGRKAADLTMLAVTKYINAGEIKKLVHLGIRDFGENRIQDALNKQEELSTLTLTSNLNWHYIGSLQTNKARQAVANFDLIHSLDRFNLATELNRQGVMQGKKVPVLIQVNISGEVTKHGLAPDKVIDFYQKIMRMPGLTLSGLMTMAPYMSDPQGTRPVFQKLRILFERIKQEFNPGPQWRELSMGMSNDFEVAIEEGATIVRIGSAIFGS